MTSSLRSFVMGHPALRGLLAPAWRAARKAGWSLRSTLLSGLPLRVAVGTGQVQLGPVGQIAEYIWHSNFEESERDFISRNVKPGMLILNIGANVGLYTLMASALTGKDGKVYAFEPSSITFDRLSNNIALNRATNVSANRIALSDQPGQVLLRSDMTPGELDGHRFVDFAADSAAAAGNADEWVDCKTLDSFLGGMQETRAVDMIIMDVEGAEHAVVRGAVQTIARSPNLTILMECSKDRRAMEDMLSAQGLEFFRWDLGTHRLVSCSFLEQASVGSVIIRHRQPN